MNNIIFTKLLEYIYDDEDALTTLLQADQLKEKDNIIAFLNSCNTSSYLTSPIIGNSILTEGDIYTTLKLINDLALYQGEYTLYINDENKATNAYLVKRANDIYASLGIEVTIIIDFAQNYNNYLGSPVTLIGSEDFVLTSKEDFPYGNYIIVNR